MTHILSLIQLISAPLLVACILLQRAEIDSGSTGGEGGSFVHTRRGFERFLFFFTIILGVIFAMSSLLVVVLSN